MTTKNWEGLVRVGATKGWSSISSAPRRRAGVSSLRRWLTRGAKGVFLLLGVYALIRRLRPNPNPAILRFHSVAGKEGQLYASPGITVLPHIFGRQIRYLSRRYNISDMDQLYRSLASKGALQPNTVILTFDDGYQDNLAAALTLRKYGCTATFYLTADCLQGGGDLWLCDLRRRLILSARKRLHLVWNGQVLDYPLQSSAEREASIAALTSWVKMLNVASREDFLSVLAKALPIDDSDQDGDSVMLSWHQVRTMTQAGMLFGGHTMSHCNLAHATDDELRAEIRGCHEVLTRQLGEPPRHFAYPNGGADAYYDERAKAEVGMVGFKTAGTSCFGFVEPESDPLELPRVGVPASLAELIHSLEWWKLKGIGRQGQSPRRVNT